MASSSEISKTFIATLKSHAERDKIVEHLLMPYSASRWRKIAGKPIDIRTIKKWWVDSKPNKNSEAFIVSFLEHGAIQAGVTSIPSRIEEVLYVLDYLLKKEEAEQEELIAKGSVRTLGKNVTEKYNGGETGKLEAADSASGAGESEVVMEESDSDVDEEFDKSSEADIVVDMTDGPDQSEDSEVFSGGAEDPQEAAEVHDVAGRDEDESEVIEQTQTECDEPAEKTVPIVPANESEQQEEWLPEGPAKQMTAPTVYRAAKIEGGSSYDGEFRKAEHESLFVISQAEGSTSMKPHHFLNINVSRVFAFCDKVTEDDNYIDGVVVISRLEMTEMSGRVIANNETMNTDRPFDMNKLTKSADEYIAFINTLSKNFGNEGFVSDVLNLENTLIRIAPLGTEWDAVAVFVCRNRRKITTFSKAVDLAIPELTRLLEEAQK